MGIENKDIDAWTLRTPVGYDSFYTRSTTDGLEVAATAICDDTHWRWIVTSDAKQVAAGTEESSELARFKADLALSEFVTDSSQVLNIFSSYLNS